LRGFRHNTALFRPASALQADVEQFHGTVDAVLLDPARRAAASLGGPRDFDADPEPGWEAIRDLLRRFPNAVVKLGAGTRLPEALGEEEREYLGWRDECLELTVRTGSLGKPGMVRAVELPAGASVEARACDLDDSFGRVEEPGRYFYEPVKCVVRAHLFGVLAQAHGLWQLDARIAYLSGNHGVDSPLLKRYRLVKVLPFEEAALRREVSATETGTLEIKKRGVDVDPEEWRRRLKPRGPNQATVIFARLQGKAAALWAERDSEPHPGAGVCWGFGRNTTQGGGGGGGVGGG
jgi:hypothetical protein